MLAGYKVGSMEVWQGRVDSVDDYDSFRWHQYIKPLDLSGVIPDSKDELAFVLIGYEVDEGITANLGRAGAKFGAQHIRANLCNKPCSFSSRLKLYDGGNVSFVSSVSAAQNTLATLVGKCLKHNYFPIVLGGGHDLSYGSLQGILQNVEANKKLGIINFDAHFDFRQSDISTSGSMFYQIYEDMKRAHRPYYYLAIGIQKSANTRRLFKRAAEYQVPYILAQELAHDKINSDENIIDKFVAPLDYIYVSVCMDVFASAFVPGVSSPQPLGIEPETFLVLLKHVMKHKKMVAFDVAETAPVLEQSSNTAGLAALIVYSLVNYYGELYI